MQAPIYKNLVDGEWTQTASNRRFPDVNPARTDDILGYFPQSSPEDMRAAVEAADRARPAWDAMGSLQRGKVLLRASRLLEERCAEIAAVITREEGKTLPEARAEVLRGAASLEFFAGEGARLCGETAPPGQPRVFLYTIRRPLGVVGLITPWNFPVAIACWKLGAALVSGNTAVLKPASLTPLSPIRLAEVFLEAGLPGGVLNVVTGPGGTVGHELVTHPKVRAISFTGSCEVGTRLYQEAARNLTRTQLEMGGKNPVIILEDADLDEAAEIAFQGAFLSTGHKCTATSRAIVIEGVLDAFTRRLVERTEGATVGDGMDPATVIGPVVDETQMNRILGFIERAKAAGAKVLTGGERLRGGAYEKGYFIPPTIFAGVTPTMEIAQEEVFGPVLAILPARDFAEAIAIANGVRFGLAASVCTRDLSRAQEFIHRIEAGTIKVNLPTPGVECHVPFGGTKASSTGFREQGHAAIEFFTEIRTVYVKY